MVELCNDKVKKLSKEPTNNKCMDCNVSNPQWASVTFGVFICLDCASVHRSMGVNTSFVKSVTMDSWSQKEYLFMKLGSNEAFQGFINQQGLKNRDTLEIYVNNGAKKYSNKLKERVFKELGISEVDYESARNSVNHQRATTNTHSFKNYSSNTNNNSNYSSSRRTVDESQSKIYETLAIVGSSLIGCMKELKNKTVEYGGKFGKHVVIPTTNMIKNQKGALSSMVFKQEKPVEVTEKKKIALFEECEQEDMRKWD